MNRPAQVAASLATLVVAACCSGCLVSSFHPIYDEASVVFDDRLIGTWENREIQVSVTVARGQWRSYAIEYTDRTGPTHFTGFLTDIAGQRFLNLRPVDGLERPAYLIASNGILRLEVTPQELRVRELDYDAVLARMKANTLRVSAVTDLQQNVVLTADTPGLRKWLAAVSQDEALLGDWKTLSRK